MTTDKTGPSASRRQFLTGAAAIGAGTVAARQHQRHAGPRVGEAADRRVLRDGLDGEVAAPDGDDAGGAKAVQAAVT